jgi:hypothetical protein
VPVLGTVLHDEAGTYGRIVIVTTTIYLHR